MKKKLKIKSLEPDMPEVVLPRSGDVGIDLYAAEDKFIELGEEALVRVGIAVEMPDDWWLNLRDRSSVSAYCHVLAGVVDAVNFRGEVKVRLLCHNSRDRRHSGDLGGFLIKKGNKITQMLICKDYNSEFEIEYIKELSETERGSGGFGSTGV